MSKKQISEKIVRLVLDEPILLIPGDQAVRGISSRNHVYNIWSDDDADSSDDEVRRDEDLSDDDNAAPPGGNRVADAPPTSQVDLSSTKAIDEFFWSRIAKINWRNRSDGSSVVPSSFFSKVPEENAALMTAYARAYDEALAILTADGIFTRYEMSPAAIARVVSHVVALGRDSYMTLLGAPDLVDFLWNNNDCQSFDIQLPNDWQH